MRGSLPHYPWARVTSGPEIRTTFRLFERSVQMRIAFFGLPLGALLLNADGHQIALAVLSPIEAPGSRRLGRVLGTDALMFARELGSELDSEVDQRLSRLSADLLVSWYWTRRIPRRWLDSA